MARVLKAISFDPEVFKEIEKRRTTRQRSTFINITLRKLFNLGGIKNEKTSNNTTSNAITNEHGTSSTD